MVRMAMLTQPTVEEEGAAAESGMVSLYSEPGVMGLAADAVVPLCGISRAEKRSAGPGREPRTRGPPKVGTVTSVEKKVGG